MHVGTVTSARRACSADRRLQAEAVRALAEKVIFEFSEEAAPAPGGSAKEPEAQAADHDAQWPTRRLYTDEAMAARLAWARGLRPDARAGILTELEQTHRLGPMRRVGVPGSSLQLEDLRASFPNFKDVLDFAWNRAVLAGSVADCGLRLPPLLLNGPPGIGKSEFSERLAAWLRVPITRVNISTLDASFRLTGLDAGYSTAKAGQVWDALQGGCISPVILLDEIDKRSTSTGDRGTSFLLGLMEPSTAKHFQDACIGLEIDASHVQWIATCNDTQEIEPALLSRFRVFNIKAPLGDPLRQVVGSIYAALRRRETWARAFPPQLPTDVVEALMDRQPRQVWQGLEDACANAVRAGRRSLMSSDVPSAPSTWTSRRIGFTS
jgi:ATP-dependent Lon protease